MDGKASGIETKTRKGEDEEEDDDGEPMNESYDGDWMSVGAAFEEFMQRLWAYTRKDRDNRIDAFKDCSNTCERAVKAFYDNAVYDGAD